MRACTKHQTLPETSAKHIGAALKNHRSSQFNAGKASKAAAVALALCAISMGQARAASLGSIVVYSHLSEPLNAVSILGGGSAKGVSAKMASAEEYAARGAKRPAWADGATLSVRELDSGRLELRVSTREPVDDPAAALIVNVEGLSGTEQIQYALMLDPASEPPRLSASPGEASSSIRAAVVDADRKVTPRHSDLSGDLKVSQGQVLSSIARERKPAGVGLDRMMLGLLRANPSAFVDGNVNRLKAGAILKMPSSQELASIGPSEAASKINEQAASFALWRSSKTPELSTISADAKPAATVGEVGIRGSASPSGDVLRLGSANGQAERLVNDVAKRRESGDAKARIADLERARDELKALAALPSSGPGGGDKAADPSQKKTSIAPTLPSFESQSAAPAAEAPAGDKPPISPTTKKQAPKTVQAPMPLPEPVERPSFLGELWSQASGSASYLAALIAVVALAAAGLIARRKKAGGKKLSADAIERGEDLPPSQSVAEPYVEPTDLEQRLNAAETFEAFGQQENAKEAYEAALKIQPGHLGALLGLAKIAHKSDKKGELARLSALIESSSGRSGPEWEAAKRLLAMSAESREAVKSTSERRGASAAISAEFESGFAPKKQESPLAPAAKEKMTSFEFKLPSLGAKPDSSGLRLAPLDLLSKDSRSEAPEAPVAKEHVLGKSSGEILMELAETYLSMGDAESAKDVLSELADGDDLALAALAREKLAKR